MTFFIVLAVAGLVMVLRMRRRARKAELAGLSAVKPQFMVEPPQRRLGTRKGEML